MSSTQRLRADLVGQLDQAGLEGWFLVRDLDTGDEFALEPDVLVPLASVVKVPLAMATLEACRTGRLDPRERVEIAPGHGPLYGPAGTSAFRGGASITIEDLVYLAVAVSDNTAADALFALTPPSDVTAELRRMGVKDVVVRNFLHELTQTPSEALKDMELSQSLAVSGSTRSGGHRVPQLDISSASVGSARGLVDLLALLWTDDGPVHPEVCARVRDLMARNVYRQRLAPDFVSDATTWSSKTGTLLNLRHEIGVVEHRDGATYAIAALTRSRVPASAQTAAESTIGRVARRMHDHLSAQRWSR
jgi:beta-lactamase class A